MTHRLHYIDNLKGVLILLVVLGHCIQCTDLDFDHNAVFRYIYSFHMPLLVVVILRQVTTYNFYHEILRSAFLVL